MWYDYNSNLYYTYGRWYSPLLQQFISEDPKRFGGGDANLFGYVHEDPINATDPLGFDEGGGGGGGCGLLCWVPFILCDFFCSSGGGGGGGPRKPRTFPKLQKKHRFGLNFAAIGIESDQVMAGSFTEASDIYREQTPANGMIQTVQFRGYNYCGPGNNGGSVQPDTTDACCKAHDQCYGSLSGYDVLVHPFGIDAGKTQRGCDSQLCGCIQGLGDRNLKGFGDNALRYGIFGLFCYP